MTRAAALAALFPGGYEPHRDGAVFAGTGTARDGTEVAVLGTADGAWVGVQEALLLAGEVLAVVKGHPNRPLLLWVDTQGQRLARREELLGLNIYLAHIAQCLALAHAGGHRVLGLVAGVAASGGFLSTGMLADSLYALPSGEPKVMDPAAMARVTRIPPAELETLRQTSPLFSPRIELFAQLGGVVGVWDGDLAGRLVEALTAAPSPPRTATATEVARRVREEGCDDG